MIGRLARALRPPGRDPRPPRRGRPARRLERGRAPPCCSSSRRRSTRSTAARRSCSSPPTARAREWRARAGSPSATRDREKVDAALVLDDIGRGRARAPVRGAVVGGLEPRLADGRAHRRRCARARDRHGRRVGVRGSGSSCAWPGRSRCASRARCSARASTRSRSPRAESCRASPGSGHARGHLGAQLTRFGARRVRDRARASTRPASGASHRRAT